MEVMVVSCCLLNLINDCNSSAVMEYKRILVLLFEREYVGTSPNQQPFNNLVLRNVGTIYDSINDLTTCFKEISRFICSSNGFPKEFVDRCGSVILDENLVVEGPFKEIFFNVSKRDS